MKMTLTKADAKITEREPLTVGMLNAAKINFCFSSEWDGLSKIAVFTAGDITKDVLLDDSNECFVPAEVCPYKGVAVYCGVYGLRDGVKVIPSVNVWLGVVDDGADPEGDVQTKTPGIWEQAIAQLDTVAAIADEAKKAASNVVDRANAGEFKGEMGDPFKYKDLTDKDKAEIVSGVYVSDDGAGNVTLLSSVFVYSEDDGDGNVSLNSAPTEEIEAELSKTLEEEY